MEDGTSGIELPEDLERGIFEMAARSGRSVAASLLTVDKRVYHWSVFLSSSSIPDSRRLMEDVRIEPLLYDVVIHKPRHLKQFTKEWYIKHGKHIRHLLMLAANGVQFIEHCPNLRGLAIWVPISPEIWEFLEPLHIRRLSIDFVDLFGSSAVFQERVQASPPLFADLTHLDLISFHVYGNWGDWNGFSLLPKLTYLAIADESESAGGIIQNAFSRCQHLRAIIIVTPSTCTPTGTHVQQRHGFEEEGDDRRLVYVEIGVYHKDWEFGARGLRDMWSLAEEIVETRITQSVS